MRITYSLLRTVLTIGALLIAQSAATQTSSSPVPGTAGGTVILPPVTGGNPPLTCSAPTNPVTGDPITACAQAGNPLNILNGNKFQREEDMPALPGVLGLELVRYYNSGVSRENSGKPIGGRGWRLSYDAELYIQPGTQTITYTQADGTATNFSPNFNTTANKQADQQASKQTQWRSNTLGAGVITSQTNLANPQEQNYKLTLPNQSVLSFNSSGKLLQITVVTGETVTIQRNNAGYPEKITDPQGRSLVFNYLDAEQKKAADRYRGIQSIDTPVGRYEYTYGSSTLNAPMTLMANLASVKLPGSASGAKGNETKDNATTRLYHYEDARFPTLLTGISIADAQSQAKGDKQSLKRLVTWGYDALGRANLSVKGEPARLEMKLGSDGKPTNSPLEPKRLAAGTGIEQVTLEFSAKTAQQARTSNTQEGSSGYTLLTNSLGQTTRYDYTTVAGQPQLTEVRGPGCVTCSASNVRYSYNKLGQRTSQTQLDNNGQPITGVAGTQTDYDAQGRVSRISSVSYTNTKGNGKLAQVKLQARYEYTGDETVASLVATPSVISNTNILGAKGKEHQIRYSRNSFGQITQVTETGFSPLLDNSSKPEELKRTTNYTYQSINGKSVLIAIADPLGNTTQYQWDAQGNTISQVRYPLGLTASMAYDPQSGRMLQTTGIDGQSTQVSYTAQGDIASWSRAGRSVSTQQDAQGRTVLWKSNDGQSIKASYDELDNKLQRQIRYTLPDGQSLVSSLSSESQTTSVGWQGNDQQSIVNAKQTAYSPSTGLPVEITAPTGLKTTLGYDQANQLNSIQRGRQTISKTTEGFDPLNQLTKLDVSGAKYTLGTKAAENSLTLPTEASYTSTVDDFGRTVIMQSPHINSGNENGKVKGKENGRSTASYDLNDKLIALKDSLRTSTASFDALGRLVQRRHSINKDTGITATVTTTSDPKDEVFIYTYEGARLKSISGPAQTTTYSYTKEGQVAQEQVTLQNNATTTSFTTNHTYDTFGRLSQTQLPEGATLSHHYNTISRLERVDYQPAAQAGWRGWWTQLARLAVPDYGTQVLVANIQTDSAHGLLGYQSSNGQTVQASFDTAGRLKTWRDGPVATTLGFNQNDELASLEKQKPALSQGQTIAENQTLQYNIMGQLSDVKTIKAAGNKESNAATQALESYSYDQNGNRLQTKQEGQQAGQNSYPQIYSYRPASDQLQSIQTGAAKSNYSYNSHGEPVQISTAQGDKTQTRDLTYGARGELLAIADTHSTSSGQASKPTASYQYNHALQRVSKTIHPSTSSGRAVTTAETTNYLWHGGMVDAEIQNGQVTKRYIFINLRAVAVIEYENVESRDKNDSVSGSKYAGYKPNSTPKSAAIYAIHTDHLGTPQAITDSQQAVVWRADYATFGKATVQATVQSRVVDGSSKTAKNSFGIISSAHAANDKSAKPFEFNLRFAGQYEDIESGYHYNWHRYYDPSTGRYLTPDPIGLAGGLNGYGYAGQDPMASVDPFGLYRLVMGFEVNNPDAFAGGVQNLSKDFGHSFFYLVDDNGRITDTFSFGPAITPEGDGITLGVPGKANYGITDPFVNLIGIDISALEYNNLKNGIKDFYSSNYKYWIGLNNTCAESSMDIVGRAIPRLDGLGKSPIKMDGLRQKLTNASNATIANTLVDANDTTKFSVTNPYALYRDLKNRGYDDIKIPTGNLTDARRQIKVGIQDPSK